MAGGIGGDVRLFILPPTLSLPPKMEGEKVVTLREKQEKFLRVQVNLCVRRRKNAITRSVWTVVKSFMLTIQS